MREVQELQDDEYGAETHPAFGLIGASRVSCTPGAVLFDSDIRHGHTVRVRIKAATRTRDLHHDLIFGREEYIEVEMSEAQWASFVSSMNSGDGVPCTVRSTQDDREVPGVPYAPRLAQSIAETREAAHEAFDDIKAAMDAYDAILSSGTAKDRREALQTLRARIANAVPNVDFAGKRLIEQTENVVTKARADIEAFVINKAQQLGLNPGDIADASLFALGAGPQEEES